MAASAYQLWLKKREFKAPRPSPSPASKGVTSLAPNPPKDLSQDSSKDAQDAPKDVSAKLHSVSAVEKTQVAVKSVARPSTVKKRPRGWLDSREEAADADGKQPPGAKVAGWKLLHSEKEGVMKSTTLVLTSTSKLLRRSSAKTELERAVLSSRNESMETSDAQHVEVPSVVLKQKRRRGAEEHDRGDRKTRLFRFDAVPKVGDEVGGKICEMRGDRQVQSPVQQKEVVKRMRTLEDGVSNDRTTKRLRFDRNDAEENDGYVEPTGLPPKSPMKKKQRKMRTAMLDESQYWMAVDRFSHLT